MKIQINHECKNFTSFRAEKVKSLFNPEHGHTFNHVADIPIEGDDWQIGLIVGPSGSGKTSLGRELWPGVDILNLYDGWADDSPIIDEIVPNEPLNTATAALAAVGLGDVPAWLKPFKALSNGQQYRAGLARVVTSSDEKVVIDEFTSVVDRQIAKIGAGAFAKAWRRSKGKQAVLLSCHYDVIEWLQPDWVYDTGTGEVKKKSHRGQKSNWKFGRQMAVTGSCLNHITI